MINPFLHLYCDNATINSEQPFIPSSSCNIVHQTSHASCHQQNKKAMNSEYVPFSGSITTMKPLVVVKPSTSLSHLSNVNILQDMLLQQEQHQQDKLLCQGEHCRSGDDGKVNNDSVLCMSSCILGLKDDDEETTCPIVISEAKPQPGHISGNGCTCEISHNHVCKTIERYILRLDEKFAALIDDHNNQVAALNLSLQTKLRREAAEFLNNILSPTNTNEDHVPITPTPNHQISTSSSKTCDDKNKDKSDASLDTPAHSLKDTTSVVHSTNNVCNPSDRSTAPCSKSTTTTAHLKTFERRGLNTDLTGDSSICGDAAPKCTTALQLRVPRVFCASSSPSHASPPRLMPRRRSTRTERSPQQYYQQASMESHTPLSYKYIVNVRKDTIVNDGERGTSSSPPYRIYSSTEYAKGYKPLKRKNK